MVDGEQYRRLRQSLDAALAQGWTLEQIERQLERPELALRPDQQDALWLYAQGQLTLHGPRGAGAPDPPVAALLGF